MKEYLARYGSDLEKWPEELMHAGFAACMSSAELRELAVKARELEEARVAAIPPEGLALDIIEAAQAQGREAAANGRGRWLTRKKIVSLIVVLIFGAIVWLLIPSG